MDRSLILQNNLILAYEKDISHHSNLSDGRAYAAMCQRDFGFSKRFVPTIDLDAQSRADKAWDLFKQMNEHCRISSQAFLGSEKVPDVTDALNNARIALQELFREPPSSSTIWDGLDPGPGASANDGGKEDTSWYSKFYQSSRTASNQGVQRFVSYLLASHHLWSAAENSRITWCIANKVESLVIHQKSKFFTVRKNANIDRGCMMEPTDNMLLQQATGRFIERILKKELVDISVQADVNRELARLGSSQRHQRYRFSTIDGTSCSDTITPSIIKYMFGQKWYSWLMSIRSPICVYNEEILHLNMISTMGNGFTFPLQTALFFGIIIGAYKTLGINLYDVSLVSETGSPKNFGVFGDDMIVVEEAYDLVVRCLEAIGIIVNQGKSFSGSSEFRESCGADYWQGYNVRPVFLTSLKSVQDRCSYLNRLMRWGFYHSFVLTECAKVLLNSIPARLRYPIPAIESDTSGIIVPFDLAMKMPHKPSPLSIQMLSKFTHVKAELLSTDYCDGYVYRRFLPAPNRKRKFMIVCWDGFEEVIYSDDLLAVLSETVATDGHVTLRSMDVKFNSKSTYTPSWCVLAPMPPFNKEGTRIFWNPVEKRYSSSVSAAFEDYLRLVYENQL